jgi:hypothetical protein
MTSLGVEPAAFRLHSASTRKLPRVHNTQHGLNYKENVSKENQLVSKDSKHLQSTYHLEN